MKTDIAKLLTLLAATVFIGASGDEQDRLHVDPNNIGLGLEHSGWGSEKLDEQVKLHPNSVAAYLERGNGHMLAGDDEEALADFDKVLKLDPKQSKAYIGRGMVYRGNRNWEKAMAELKKAASMPPKDVAIDAVNLAGAYCRLAGRLPEALADFDQVIKSGLLSKKRLAYTYSQRGMTLDQLGKPQQAIADYTQSITLYPDRGITYVYRGNDYAGLGDPKKAIADYSYVINHRRQVQPDGTPTDFANVAQQALKQRAALYSRNGRPDLAKADRTLIYRLDKEDVDISPFSVR